MAGVIFFSLIILKKVGALMQIKTITTVAGVNEINFGNDSSQSTAHFYWLKNLGDSTLYVSVNPNPVAEKDNVAELPAKGAVSVETDEGKIYVLGAGKVEIHRANSKFCPFDWQSSGSGGGGTIDAYTKTESDAKYAQKTDIPTTLPANGGNADTVDGLHADDFIKSTDPTINGDLIFRSSSSVNSLGAIYSASDILVLRNISNDGSNLCDVEITNDRGVFINGKEISTTPIKSTGQITSPTDQYGVIILPNSDTRRYLSITTVGCYAEMLLTNNEYAVHIKNGNYEAIINTPVTYIAFYIE